MRRHPWIPAGTVACLFACFLAPLNAHADQLIADTSSTTSGGGSNLFGTVRTDSGSGVTSHHIYVDVNGGFASLSIGKTQNVFVGSSTENTYTPTQNPNDIFLGLGLGYRWTMHNDIHAQLGLQIQSHSNMKALGKVYLFKDPAYHNYNYSYHYSNTSLFATTQVSHTFSRYFSPYLRAAVGWSYNTASDFTETPVSSGAVVKQFARHTKGHLAYAAGAGLEWPFTDRFWGHVGYQYQHFGSIRFKPASGQTLGPNTDAVSEHAVVYGVSILF